MIELITTSLERLPSMFSITLRAFFKENQSNPRLHRLCDADDILIRFLAAVALGELRRGYAAEPLPETVLKVLQPRIERSTFGRWRYLSALFSAFGYMKERAKRCGRMFVFIRNFGFFWQVTNRFFHLGKDHRRREKKGRLPLMRCANAGLGVAVCRLSVPK